MKGEILSPDSTGGSKTARDNYMMGRYHGYGDEYNPALIFRSQGRFEVFAVTPEILSKAKMLDEVIFKHGALIHHEPNVEDDCIKRKATCISISPTQLSPEDPDPTAEDDTFIPIENIQINLFVAPLPHRADSMSNLSSSF